MYAETSNFNMPTEYLPISNARNVKNMWVEELLLQQTGTYHNQYFRPYTSYMDNKSLNDVLSRIDQMGPHAKLTSSVFSGLTNNLITPSPIVNFNMPAKIPNGWNETRSRFILILVAEFTIGTRIKYVVQGFTDHLGFTPTGNVDPNMVFYINSITTLNEILVSTPMGTMQQYRVVNTEQFINDFDHTNSYIDPNNVNLITRPMDIYSALQVSGMDPNGFGGDRRSVLTIDPMISNRTNNIPTNYMSKIVDTYLGSRNQMDMNQSDADILNQSKASLLESTAYNNPFISTMAKISGMQASKVFTFKQLLVLDPQTDNKTKINWLNVEDRAQLANPNNSEVLHGADRTTQVAVILANAVPALMMECLITKMGFQSTNKNPGGQITTSILGAESVVAADLRPYFDLFIRRIEQEVILDFTYNNQTPYFLTVHANLFGDTTINISVDNYQLTPFVFPSFGDSLYAGVITPSVENFRGLVNDFGVLLDNVREVRFGGLSEIDI